MKHLKKALFLSSVLWVPSIVAHSQSNFSHLSDDGLVSCQSFKAVGEDEMETNHSVVPSTNQPNQEDLPQVPQSSNSSKDVGFQKQLAKHLGTMAFQTIYPKIKSELWRQIRITLTGTGQYALLPDGTEAPVVTGQLKGYVDLILGSAGAPQWLRTLVNASSSIVGKTADSLTQDLAERLKEKLDIQSSLEAFVEKMAQKATLMIVDSAPAMLEGPARVTLSEIKEMQASIEAEEDREAFLESRNRAATLQDAIDYLAYEFKNTVNDIVQNILQQHLYNYKQEIRKNISSTLQTTGINVATVGAITLMPSVAGVGAVTYLSANYVVGSCLDYSFLGVEAAARDFAAYTLSEAEIKKNHSKVVRTSVTPVTLDEGEDENDHWQRVDDAVHYGTSLVGASAANTFSSTVNSVGTSISQTLSKVTSFFGRFF